MADDVRVLELREVVFVSSFVVPSPPAWAEGLGVLMARTSTQGFSPVLL
jgi:hypothetical protein